MTSQEVAAALDEIGTLLEVKGENAFRAGAYHKAAEAVENLQGDLAAMIESGELAQVKGIGQTMLETITSLVRTGEHPYLTRLRSEVPKGLFELLHLPGLGVKKIKALHEQLGVTDLASLKEACETNRVAGLKGFGEKVQQKLLEGIAFAGKAGQRVRIDQSAPLADALLERLRALPGVTRAAVVGSLRRRKETVGNIDLVASASDAAALMDAFAKVPEATRVVGQTGTSASVLVGLRLGGQKVELRCDLRVVPDAAFPFALLHFTGSAGHTAKLRAVAEERGLSLSESGPTGSAKGAEFRDEEAIYRAIGLAFVPPEMREDTGEVEAAGRGEVPALIEVGDVRGVLHNHTTYSDGGNTLEEMALAAKALGLEYFGVGDHSQSLKIARGMSPAAVKKQHREIDAVNARLDGVRILKGVECDILEDGTLDYDDELLKGFDYVVASVHSYFAQPRDVMTARVCRALAHPATTILGHATGRLLLRREGYQIDLDEVLRVAARHGKMIEINAHPARLDLDWTWCKKAKALGIPLVINPDAHSTGELALYPYGVDVARRGWLTKDDVFNTRSLKEVVQELERRKKRA